MRRTPMVDVALFVGAVALFFVFLGASVPQGEQARRGKVDVDKLNKEELLDYGRNLFNGKGTCYNCHAIGSGGVGRCPDLGNVGARAATRRAGLTAEQYLAESLYDPTAYVVEGFGPIMPPVYGPPMVLSDGEIKALVAFLQSQGGEVTAVPGSPLAFDTERYGKAREAAAREVRGNPEKGRELFFHRARCVACHRVGARGGVLGPELTAIGAFNSPDYLKESIVAPDAKLVKGYAAGIMPQNWKEHLTDAEIDDLVAYLLTLRGQGL